MKTAACVGFVSAAILAIAPQQGVASPLRLNPFTRGGNEFLLDKNFPGRGDYLEFGARNTSRRLETSNTDIARLEAYFGERAERNVENLPAEGEYPTIPWPSSYWPAYADGINVRWATNQLSPAEKYAKAFGLNIKTFTDTVSQSSGVLSRQNPTRSCVTDVSCSIRKDNSVCAKHGTSLSGYCIPTWYGLCHAWAPAALLEPEPKCPVTINGVTFYTVDIKALLIQMYDGSSLPTVFTGVRFDGDDASCKVDKYGRFVDDARRDLGPGYFHIAVGNMLGLRKKSFIIDIASGSQVWNQPVYSYKVLSFKTYTPAQAGPMFFNTEGYPFNSAAVKLLYIKNRVSWVGEDNSNGALVSTGRVKLTHADYEYVLELDASNNILGGEWTGGSKVNHPDFLWFAKDKPAAGTVSTTGIKYSYLQDLLAKSTSTTC